MGVSSRPVDSPDVAKQYWPVDIPTDSESESEVNMLVGNRLHGLYFSGPDDFHFDRRTGDAREGLIEWQ
jgi:hypothetical protein